MSHEAATMATFAQLYDTVARLAAALREVGVRPGDRVVGYMPNLPETAIAMLAATSAGAIWASCATDLGPQAALHFNSISGGTDINGCFAAGSPIQPVYAGELQGPVLAMKVKAYDEQGNPVWDQQGELVCEAPSPSMPLYFWNDPDGQKYRSAYFTFYPHKNVWRHGDFIVMHSDTGGITFYGRSDSVLKPAGVRIGTAEIYNVVESMEEVADSLAIGQNWEGDQRILVQKVIT